MQATPQSVLADLLAVHQRLLAALHTFSQKHPTRLFSAWWQYLPQMGHWPR